MSSPTELEVKQPEEVTTTTTTTCTMADPIAHETAATMISELANSSRARADPRSSVVTAVPLSDTAVVLETAPNAIFSSIGLGMVNDFAVDSDDATDAALKAIQDSLERGGLGLSLLQNLVLSVRVGVPARPKQPNVPMHVDPEQLKLLVPPAISLSRLEVVIGGLLSPVSCTPAANRGGICSAVACLSFFQQGSPAELAASGAVLLPVGGPVTGVGGAAATTGVIGMKPTGGTQHGFTAHPTVQQLVGTPSAISYGQEANGRHQVVSHPSLPSLTNHPRTFHRANSMELLAQISAEIRDRQPDNAEDTRSSTMAHNYKKLPPGKTPKNNRRLFVKHQYNDFSNATPTPGEEFLVRPEAPLRTPNAAFPLKLHETLQIIANDGLDHVIGWMPHGRSFKIHKHQEFVEEILPKYFVMTKKSSFLRQLNLYGFNRLSGSGPDQGSYYHEKFLRGLKFICRRMARIKVNGNGIRAAGNPDDEPNFAIFPVCPPGVSAPVAPVGLPVSDQEEGDGHQYSDTGHHSLPSLNSEAHLHVQSSKKQTSSEASPGRQAYKVAANQQHSFPLRLQRMLDKLEAEENADIVSWLPHGRGFMVHDADRFVSELMPVYFNQTKYSSFQRQLHMYNFSRITTGRDKGAYWNIHFQRGKPSLTVHMPRTRVNGKGTRRPAEPEREPDLWKEPPLPPIKPGTTVLVPSMTGGHLAGQYSASPGSDAEGASDQGED